MSRDPSVRSGAAVVGVFEHRADAERAVDALERAGFTDREIGFLSRDSADGVVRGDRPGTMTDPDADGVDEHVGPGKGAAMGVGLGAVLGALGALVIPGAGPVVAGGILAAALGGAAVGGVTGGVAGGITGALLTLRVTEDEARYYDSEFQAGRTLVTIDAPARSAEAQQIMRQHGAYDIERRAAKGEFLRASCEEPARAGEIPGPGVVSELSYRLTRQSPPQTSGNAHGRARYLVVVFVGLHRGAYASGIRLTR
jgi:hypothetical protein